MNMTILLLTRLELWIEAACVIFSIETAIGLSRLVRTAMLGLLDVASNLDVHDSCLRTLKGSDQQDLSLLRTECETIGS